MKYAGIDLFSGCGGLSLGALNAGIEIAAAVETDKNAAETFRKNHPNVCLIEKNIAEINPSHLKKTIFKGENPFILMGGPPCQGFSVSNRQSRNLKNKNNLLYLHFIQFVKLLEPRWILFENVQGLKYFRKGLIFDRVITNFRSLGYQLKFSVLNAADYGVPQLRKRLFIVGWLDKNIDFQFPVKLIKNETDFITVNDALNDLPTLENGSCYTALKYKCNSNLSKYKKRMRNGNSETYNHFVSRNKDYVIERYKYIKQGENWASIPEHLMTNYKDKNKCHSTIYYRLRPNKPSVVIGNYRKNMLIHPSQDRGLSVREAARLQSFPDDFVFWGDLGSQQQQVGNAVPPLLAEAIFSEIIKTEKRLSRDE